MRLNVGSHGTLDDWVGIDLYHSGNVRADAVELPFPDRTFTHVLASHVLEHLTLDNARAALDEIVRVAQPEARVCVRGPDCLVTGHVTATRIGNPDIQGGAHLWECTEALLTELCNDADLVAVEDEEEWPVSMWPLHEVQLVRGVQW